MTFALSDPQLEQYHRDGYLIVQGLFDREEIDLLSRIARADHRLEQQAASRRDGEGGVIRLSVRNALDEDIYSAFVRSRRIVDTMERLLGGEVYHYHHKMILKEPFTGGAWEWHQDYGYWYHNGCIFPHLASCQVALDRSTSANGCLQMVQGSHLLGRIDHVPVPGEGQNVADPARMEHVLRRLQIVPCELEPGDAVFFHANTLHRSDQNRSPHRRWTLICCYNRIDDDTVERGHDRFYVPLDKVPDSAVKAAGLRFASGDEHFTSRPFVPKVA